MAVVVSEITLMAWVDVAEPGARLAYHTGFLVVDTTANVSKLARTELEGLRATADAAYRLFELGRIHLVQERLGPDRFAYLAIARPQEGAARCAAVKQLAAAA
ncbi:hypothetical protein [Phaeovulum sp. NW3]|uniref:hypothetical protein n=1 Tax=Phaeovulum sp. NW3 TaxID=2934933 RepID=UPI00202182D9|nr:hypothetical protein [Phaeovulum sp. NW3]MCL7466083.1 hypothetical protein [Phaeovulum sp. NW3]